jgi:FlaA1/EpsC-like NDP-sugar epimerase
MSKIKSRLLRLLNRIHTMDRVPRLVVWLVQLSIFVFSGLGAFLIRFDFTMPAVHVQHLAGALPIWLMAKAIVFRLCGLDRGWWRFVSIHDVFRIGAGNLLGSLAGAGLILTLLPPGFPRSIYLLDLLICLLATTSVRVFTRMVQESLHNGRQTSGEKAVLIYGAGGAGVTLLRELRSNPALQYKVLGLVDDNPQKRGIEIQGVKVLGSGNALATLISKHGIQEVLIALPSATGREMTAILRRCHQAGVRCRTVPTLAEMIEGRALAHQIRDVAVEDLLGRTPVRLKQGAISARLGGRVVLVTGAAGSIGSELCRQIACFRPSAIVGFEIAETALFHLERELRQSFPDLLFYPEIGSIQDPGRLDEVFRNYSPALLYHAAAYKHVPMMETHAFEAVKNNVLGTYHVALAATRHGVEDFVMISTDKAVHPTSIMGATKRLAELLILSLQNGGLKYVSVRFGNVLGSNGSVIPIFKRQIAAGGPVTVTHPEMRRYFMTIPEASQLVIQASTMGHGGEIFVLDMGAPVKIVDLARNLILLSGLRPDQDIKIEFSGIRPGEKLYEELNSMEEDMLSTPHEKIKIFAGNGLPSAGMESYIEPLRDICARRDLPALLLILKEIIPDYNPSAHLLQKALHSPQATPVAA